MSRFHRTWSAERIRLRAGLRRERRRPRSAGLFPSSGKSAAPGSRRPYARSNIDGSHDDHDKCGKGLSCGEGEVVSAEMSAEQGRGNGGEDESGKSQKSRGQRSHADGALETGTHPAEKISPEWTEAAAEVDVGAARLGECRAQFGIAEGAAEHDEAAGDPGNENQGG